MKLEVSKFYHNKTRLLMLPSLLSYGKEFQAKFNSVYKFAVGVHDTTLNLHTDTEEPLIYILLDKEMSRKHFKNFVNWLKNQPYYVRDYIAGSALDTRRHMVVLRVPKPFIPSYEAFMQGRYSEMYTDEVKRLFFEEQHRKHALRVLNKTYDALLDYVNKVNATFDHDLTVTNCKEHREYDFPLEPKKEIFNYTGDVKDRQFCTKVNKTWMEIEIKDHNLLESVES